jgi:ubiquinone/menaquinone biosynthesis C-methylase UbiE
MTIHGNISSGTHVCPWWFIHTFDNPLRRLIHKPERILQGLIKPGDHCLDIGCGYGYFTIPIAGMAGTVGSVTAADVQPEMLAGVRRRAEKQNLTNRIIFYQVQASGIQFENAFDFALAFWMVHEVPDQETLLRQIFRSLKSEGRFLLVEPKGHVKEGAFNQTVQLAREIGFVTIREVPVSFSRGVLLGK